MRDAFPKFSEEWWNQEIEEYIVQIKKIGIPAFMINGIIREKENQAFGGGWIISKDFSIIESMNPFQEGILYCDL